MKPKLCLLFAAVACYAPLARAAEVVLPSTAMSDKSANIKPADPRWDGLAVCYGREGFGQWTAKLGAAGKYYLHWRLSAGDSRPVNLSINGRAEAKAVLGDVTGGFFQEHLAWRTTGPFDLAAGENTIRFDVFRAMPHFAGVVVSTDAKPPAADPFVAARQKLREAAAREVAGQSREVRAKLRELMPGVEQILFVRRYTLQSSHYYTDFVDGCRHFGGNLCLLSLADGKVTDILSDTPLTEGIIGRCDLSYDGKRVVFGHKQRIGEGCRIWEGNVDGSGLRQLTFAPPDEDARIAKYRLAAGGDYHHHTDDMHPCYLPDGGICFVSTRCEFGVLCDVPDRLPASVLYRMDADGSNVQKLSNSAVSESAPSVMHDGRILYTRWEYVDKGTCSNKALWAIRPDGSGSAEIYGTDIVFPPVFNVGRAVPGSNSLFVCIGAPHMPLGVGTLMRIDTRLDLRTPEPASYITPEVDVRHQWGWDNVPGGAVKPFLPETQGGRDGRGNTDKGPLYMDPYPIDAEQMLVSHNPDQPWNAVNAYGVYLIDVQGNCRPIHRDADASCWMPMPVRRRVKPPVPRHHPDPELAAQGLARVVVADVSRGLDGVEPGTVKYLRVNAQIPRPWAARRFWDGDGLQAQHSAIAKRAALALRVQIGTVPVEADGSAHLLVPANQNIFFQVLDENYMEVQRERTFVNYRPGEVRSCVGCHEKAKDLSTTQSVLPIALTREPDVPGPLPGETTGARPLHYPTDVQPVWDAHCIECHGAEKPDGDLNLTGELTTHFNRSYEELMDRKLLPIIGEIYPKVGNNEYLPPYTLGSHAAKLIQILREGHYDVELSPAEWVRVCAWVDANGQYYGTYYGRKNLKYRDHPNFRPVPTYENAASVVAPLPDDQR